jgi:hypothetical protein
VCGVVIFLKELRGFPDTVTVSAPLIMKEAGEFNLGDESAFPKTLESINLALTSAQAGVSQSTATGFSNSFDLTVTPYP